MLDLRGNIPTPIHVSDREMYDVNVLEILVPGPGAFGIMFWGYVDFGRLFLLYTVGVFFVIRAKTDTRYQRRFSHPAHKTTGARREQIGVLTGAKGKIHQPQPVPRIKYHDGNTQETSNFLTNQFTVPSLIVAESYRYRRQVELFFKWIKKQIRIKSFSCTPENAVTSQI